MKFLFISKTKAKQLVFPFVLVAGSLAAVGFAGADREAPVIKTKELTVAYGSIVTASDIKVTDNKTPNNRLKVTCEYKQFTDRCWYLYYSCNSY